MVQKRYTKTPICYKLYAKLEHTLKDTLSLILDLCKQRIWHILSGLVFEIQFTRNELLRIRVQLCANVCLALSTPVPAIAALMILSIDLDAVKLSQGTSGAGRSRLTSGAVTTPRIEASCICPT